MYSATKSFLRILTESIALELRGTGVKIQALCPGFTHTEFHDSGELKGVFNKNDLPKTAWMTADKVIQESLDGFKKGKVVLIPGRLNRFLKRIMTSSLFYNFAQELSVKKKLTQEKVKK